ncbi:hypothetical protein [Kingella kingae]|uniref:hypothetical protein n=1 Tax=Kingella kingae TaxID=504 RepID=UPI00040B518A|nr:hypothetical protein [Kingella kingae]MDK4564548.1 hypothetical protein [Kingella kingae]MDK4626991.1 hypothetical protein [Kingella kingae]MDK4674699.1 hypothetical protein [Kingella kingae]
MFKRPEEVIMAILALLYLVLTYFLAGWATAASVKYTFLILGFNAVWAIAAFLLWQADRIRWLVPLLLGVLVLCWTPWLDWFMLRDVLPAADGSVLLPPRPWYATWWFKGILALIPVVAGYIWQYKRHHHRKINGLI